MIPAQDLSLTQKHVSINLDVPAPPLDITSARTQRLNRIERVDLLDGLTHEYRHAA